MNFIEIGKFVSTHGVKGEIKLYPYSNDLNNLCKLKYVYLDSIKYKVKNARVHKNMVIFKLENINSIEDCNAIMNKSCYIIKEEIKEDDVYYISDLINLDVYEYVNDEYVYFGVLTDVLQPGANDVYEIKRINGDLVYIPAIKDCIIKVDIDNKKMYVKIMKGLL